MAPSVFTELASLAKILVPSVPVEGWADAQEKLEAVTETIAVIAVKTIRSIVDRKLGAEPNVEAVAV